MIRSPIPAIPDPAEVPRNESYQGVHPKSDGQHSNDIDSADSEYYDHKIRHQPDPADITDLRAGVEIQTQENVDCGDYQRSRSGDPDIGPEFIGHGTVLRPGGGDRRIRNE